MDVTVVTYDGGIEDFPLLVQTVDNLIDGGVRHVVIDLDPLPFINSAALGYLLSVHQQMRRNDGELVLCRVSKGIRNVIRLADLEDVLPMFDTEEEAVAELHGRVTSAGGEPRTRRRGLRDASEPA